jgi:hypothetical protein
VASVGAAALRWLGGEGEEVRGVEGMMPGFYRLEWERRRRLGGGSV